MNSALLLLGLAVQPLNVYMVKQEDAPAAVKTTRQRYVRLSGNVHLSGSGHVPHGGGFVTVTTSGYATLRDDQGRSLSGQVRLTDTQTYHMTGSNHVSGWARPRERVSIYHNGRYLGSIDVGGSIYVSGWVNGGWVNLSGSGTVDGSGYIEDPQPPQAP